MAIAVLGQLGLIFLRMLSGPQLICGQNIVTWLFADHKEVTGGSADLDARANRDYER